MARIKPKNSITNKSQAEEALSRISTIDRQLAELDLEEANAIAKVREEYAKLREKKNCPALLQEKTLLVKELETWAESDCSNWVKKTFITPFGKCGFKIGNPAVVLIKKKAKSFKDVIGFLQFAGLDKYIRKVEEVDKETILADERGKQLDVESLEACGLKVKQDDEFWIESAASKDLDEAAKKLKAA